MKLKPGLSTWLDALRWISSLAVAAGHVRQVVMVSPSQPQELGFAWQGFYFVTGFGHQAVMVFFVLSGFLVGGSVLEEFREGKFGWTSYLIKRISRLYPALLATLVIGGLLDLAGIHWWNESGVYSGAYATKMLVLSYDAAERLTWTSFFGNLMMLQTIYVPTFGTNGPLWSLCNEFWYYVLFPLLLGALQWWQGWSKCVLMLALAVGLFVCLPSHIVIYFSLWLLGVGIHLLGKPRLPAWVASVLFLGVLLLSRVWPWELTNFLLGLSVAALVWSITDHSSPIPGKKLHKRLADFSYSLYVGHFPIVIFLAAVLHEVQGSVLSQEPNLRGLVIFICILAAAVAGSFGIAQITEQYTDKWRGIAFALVGLLGRQCRKETGTTELTRIS